MYTEAPSPRMQGLGRQQSLELLSQHHVARIAWQAADAQQILPITYTMFNGLIYFRTSPDSILSELLRPTPVALEVDELDQRTRTGWSVVVHGQSRAVAEPAEVTRLWAIDPVPWAPGGRHLFIEVRPTQITGRTISRQED
jgi:nitroimidazol reductase NimA-like FMN-containing flavoprotein (pyridoxamine 5'-phosphate oxidase superfamily)